MKNNRQEFKHLPIHDITHPRCTSKKQYDAWRKLCDSSAIGGLVYAGFCTDCTPEFQKEKMAQCLCDYPECLFYMDKDGFIDGSFTIRSDKCAITPDNKY